MAQNKKENGKTKTEVRRDGYVNLMNKYGTKKDLSEQYRFESDDPVTDYELTLNYEENGLFSKIIDIPADDAVSGGFTYGTDDIGLEGFINDSLDELEFEEKASAAIRWARLYGGSLMVMLINDGGELEDPVDWDNIQGIDELLVFERPLITPDYNSIYNRRMQNGKWSKFGMPEYYDISPVYGQAFRVHESRCLLFRNGTLPQSSSKTEYRFFGIPEYVRVHKAMQETATSHGNGVKLLDRAVQAVYKMKDLEQLLATEQGEDAILKRLEIIDQAKGLLNSIAIDADSEDYDYKTITFSGTKDIIDATCNMLSAVTNIPQTKLFGRSPAGENSTGESDMENYYTFVGKIQKLNLKKNLGILIDIILEAGKYKGEFEQVPDYTLEFKPLWYLTDAEQAAVDQQRAATEMTKAQTAQIYVDMQALDPQEVRKRLAENGEFTVNDILEEDDFDWSTIAASENQSEKVSESEETEGTALSEKTEEEEEKNASENGVADESNKDEVEPGGCGVIVVKNGKILCGTRKDNGLICGPGGHIENGETPEEAAIRETREEFGINIAETVPLDVISGMPSEYCPSKVFLCTEYFGEPICFNIEMENAEFEDIRKLMQRNDLFLPFALSLRVLIEKLGFHTDTDEEWVTTEQGKHFAIDPDTGEVTKGNIGVAKPGEKINAENHNNELKNTVNHVTVKEIEDQNFQAHKAVGAMASKFYVKSDMDVKADNDCHIKEGTTVTGIKVMCSGNDIRDVNRLIKTYKKQNGDSTKSSDWYKVRGTAILSTQNGDRKAEIHWYQCKDVGKREFKVKRWYDEG